MSKTPNSYSHWIKNYFSLFLSSLFCFQISHSQNAIVTENMLAGNTYTDWGVTTSADFRNVNLNGYATDISVNKGSTVHFKVDGQNGVPFTIQIFRLGYYGGNGACLKADLGSFSGLKQPAGNSDPKTGLLDCSNWSETTSWNVPSSAVSGIYIAKLESAAGRNHIVFIVRDDASSSKLVFQTNDATWQAYNGYGGNNLYNGTTSFPAGHAVKVSYNRPFFIYNAGWRTDNRGSDWYMNDAYPMLRWLERNGYDMTYISNVDVARSGSLLLNHKIYVAQGHDEYWSKEMRDNVEAARTAGVNLAFFTGNEVYWKTRWENDVNGNAYRIMVCYKEGAAVGGEASCGYKCDVSTSVWTGQWRMGAAYDAPLPENALTGEISWWDGTLGAMQVPYAYKNLRFWRNTSIASLSSGQTATLAPNTLGYEWDFEQYVNTYPHGRITMSNTTFDANVHTHKLSLYRDPSGAYIFGAGTVQWMWGLDDQHFGGSGNAMNQDMQQATLNLFADMGVQPGSKQSSLVTATASTDVTPPTSAITSPTNGSTLPISSMITISGTASDVGGAVGGVEVSTDGGSTWNAANGTTSWTYSWNPSATGTFTIKCRGFDDTGNMQDASGSSGANVVTVTLIPGACPCSIFTSQTPAQGTSNDGQPLELGVKFRSTSAGLITGVKFYKTSGNSGTHIGQLFSSTGTLLASATFAGETATGWQTVTFSSPVSINANTTYVAAYFSSAGNYTGTANYLTSAVINSPLSALADGTDGPNSVYKYTASPTFPSSSAGNKPNYWVDVVYSTGTSSPVANAGSNQTITLPTSSVSLNGSASSGTITSYAWNLVSGPNTPVITTPNAVSTTVTGLIAGTYVFQLSLNAGVSTSQVTITVNASTAPVANAGSNQTITLPTSSVSLNGSASTGTITSYTWNLVSGPNTPVITTPNAVSTTVTGLIAGTYVFQLSLNAGVSTSQVTITVNASTAPVANAGSNQTITLPTNSVTLNGSGSTGTITSYAWTEVSGPNTPVITTPATVTTTVTGLIQGTYVFLLSLNSAASTSQVTVTVDAAGTSTTIFTTQSPVATTDNDHQSTVGQELGVKFSSTSAGFINGIRFYKTAGNSGTHIGELYSTAGARLAQATFTGETATGWQTVLFSSPVAITANTTYTAAYFSSLGNYTEDNDYFLGHSVTNSPLTAAADGTNGANGTDPGTGQGTYKYTAAPAFPNQLFRSANYWVDVVYSPSGSSSPVANAGTNQTITLPTSSVTLNGTASTGTITSYGWTKISGPNTPGITTPTAASTTVTGLIQGTYVFQLSINAGVSTSQVTITVNPVPPPIANAGPNQTIALPASSVTLDGTGSTGTISSYAWTNISGPNTPFITTPNAVTTNVTGLIQGTYVFQLALNAGASTSQVTITVNPAVTSSTIFTTQTPVAATDNDHQSTVGQEVGVKFTSGIAGFITGIRFYKTTGNTGTHIGELYSSTGVRLAQATFTNETATGWQTVSFSSAVAITAGTTYTAAYFSSLGYYTEDNNYFLGHSVVNSPLTAPADVTNGASGTDPGNGQGTYRYTASPAFPNQLYKSANYWVDAIFSTSSTIAAEPARLSTAKAVDTMDPSAEILHYSLGQNYPNPVSTSQNTRIEYSVPILSKVELVLYDIQGRPVKIMINETKDAGKYAYDLNTSVLAKGMYFYSIQSGKFYAVKKLVIQ